MPLYLFIMFWLPMIQKINNLLKWLRMVSLEFLRCSYIVYTTQADEKRFFSIFPVKFSILNSASYYLVLEYYSINIVWYHIVSKPVAQVVE